MQNLYNHLAGFALINIRLVKENISVLARISALGGFQIWSQHPGPFKCLQQLFKALKRYLNLLNCQIQEGVLIPHPNKTFWAFTTHARAQAAI